MTATVETVAEQLDLAAIMPAEKVVTAVARSVTLTETDVGNASTFASPFLSTNRQQSLLAATATAQVAKPQLISTKTESEVADHVQDDDLVDDSADGDEFWHTSVGKFKFALDQLPQTLQYIHQLLIELPNIEKPDILYFMLQCLNVLALHGDALAEAAREHRGFFIWCQENLLIKKYAARALQSPD